MTGRQLGYGVNLFNRLKKHPRTSVKNEENGYVSFAVETNLIGSTFSEEYTEEQTDEEIITPSSGNLLIVTSVALHTKANSGTVSIDIGSKKVARLYSSVNNRFQPIINPIRGEVDEPVVLNTETGSDRVFILITYIEVKKEDVLNV